MDDLFVQYVYVIVTRDQEGQTQFCKVGVSSNPWSRCYEMQTGCPHVLSVYRSFAFDSRDLVLKIEKQAHEFLAKLRSSGEWFFCSAFEAELAVIDAILFHKMSGWTAIDLSHFGIDDAALGQLFGSRADKARLRRLGF